MVLVVSKTEDKIFKGQMICHNCWDIIVNISGQGEMIAGKQIYPFELNTIFCVPPNTPHCKNAIDGYIDLHVYATTFLSANHSHELLVLKDDELHTLQQLFMQMHQMFARWTPVRGQLLEELYHTAETFLLFRLNHKKNHPVIEEITNAITDHFKNPDFSVNTLWLTQPYCTDYLRRLFKEYHGCSPTQYLTKIRLEHAKSLLLNQTILDYSIPQIAFQCGFGDPNYFSRVFKKATGYSPLQYAKKFFS